MTSNVHTCIRDSFIALAASVMIFCAENIETHKFPWYADTSFNFIRSAACAKQGKVKTFCERHLIFDHFLLQIYII